MSKKLILVSLLTILLFSDLLSFASRGFASATTNEITTDQFLDLITQQVEYADYEPYFVYDDPVILNPILDEDETQFGWIAQYEIDLNKGKEIDDYLQFNSLLTFLYSFEEQAFEVIFLDYSNVHQTKELTYTNLRTGETNNIDISDVVGLSEAIDTANEEVAEESKNDSNEFGLMNQMCWVCFEYETIPHTIQGNCAAIIGASCTIPNFTMFGRVVCAGATIVGCWVPGYRKCVRGQMQPVCP